MSLLRSRSGFWKILRGETPPENVQQEQHRGPRATNKTPITADACFDNCNVWRSKFTRCNYSRENLYTHFFRFNYYRTMSLIFNRRKIRTYQEYFITRVDWDVDWDPTRIRKREACVRYRVYSVYSRQEIWVICNLKNKLDPILFYANLLHRFDV